MESLIVAIVSTLAFLFVINRFWKRFAEAKSKPLLELNDHPCAGCGGCSKVKKI